jgi:hypothetical protein
MLDEKDLAAALEEAPESAPTRNINYDVHAGYAAQRPYAHLEDRMGRTRGYRTFEEMRAAGADIEKDERTGDWVRVTERIVDTRVLPDGRRQVATANVTRPVALTVEEARAIRGDTWDAGMQGWIRNGLKQEKEYPENVGVVAGQKVIWKDAETGAVVAQSTTGAAKGGSMEQPNDPRTGTQSGDPSEPRRPQPTTQPTPAPEQPKEARRG